MSKLPSAPAAWNAIRVPSGDQASWVTEAGSTSPLEYAMKLPDDAPAETTAGYRAARHAPQNPTSRDDVANATIFASADRSGVQASLGSLRSRCTNPSRPRMAACKPASCDGVGRTVVGGVGGVDGEGVVPTVL